MIRFLRSGARNFFFFKLNCIINRQVDPVQPLDWWTDSSRCCNGQGVFLLAVCSLFSNRVCLMCVIKSHMLIRNNSNCRMSSIGSFVCCYDFFVDFIRWKRCIVIVCPIVAGAVWLHSPLGISCGRQWKHSSFHVCWTKLSCTARWKHGCASTNTHCC